MFAKFRQKYLLIKFVQSFFSSPIYFSSFTSSLISLLQSIVPWFPLSIQSEPPVLISPGVDIPVPHKALPTSNMDKFVPEADEWIVEILFSLFIFSYSLIILPIMSKIIGSATMCHGFFP